MCSFRYQLTAVVVVCFSVATIEQLSAGSEIAVTGGGIIKERVNDENWKISFSLAAFGYDSEVETGHFQIRIHDVDDSYALDKSEFSATDFEYIVFENREFEGTPYKWAKFLVHGSLDGEEGWSAEVRLSDFGTPVRNRSTPDNHSDAIRFFFRDPDWQGGDPFYFDTALEFTLDQFGRTLLDGGNFSIRWAETICGIPKPLEEGICLCGFPELFCTSPIINCETSEDCSEISCGGLPTCVQAGNDFPDECGPDNSEGCYYVEE